MRFDRGATTQIWIEGKKSMTHVKANDKRFDPLYSKVLADTGNMVSGGAGLSAPTGAGACGEAHQDRVRRQHGCEYGCRLPGVTRLLHLSMKLIAETQHAGQS
jgi:hypothetical protein